MSLINDANIQAEQDKREKEEKEKNTITPTHK